MQVCVQCSRANPAEASYCYYDGVVLQGRGGPLQPGSQPFPRLFVLPSGAVCRNFDQLAQECQKNWNEARHLLEQGVLERFLGGLGRADLAMAARAAAAFPDPDRGLDQLLSRLPTTALAPPKLAVEPAEINFGTAQVGSDYRLQLRLINHGLRLVYGSMVSDCLWLTPGESPGSVQKLVQFSTEATVPVFIRGQHLRAGPIPLEGRLVIESNAGTATVVVRVPVAVKRFPEGVLAGATTPRQIAEKAKAAPKEAAALFENGAVAQWYRDNGWNYPVQGPSGSGLGAVQQFFEALGLVRAPKVEISDPSIKLHGWPGDRLQYRLQVRTQENRPVFAHARSDDPWLIVCAAQFQGAVATLPLEIHIPDRPGELLHSVVHVTANGNQRFVVAVAVTVAVGPNIAVAVPAVPVPAQTMLSPDPVADLVAKESPPPLPGVHETVTLLGQETVLGRDPTCDQVLNYPMISRQHARLLRSAKGIVLEDLHSTNGTFINGKRVRGTVLVRPGDVISLGSFSFTLAEGGKLHKRDFRGNVSLQARKLAVDIPGRRLLENVSVAIQPGELVGLMGGSGAGKTTLLSALNGYVVPSEGEVLLNGHDLYEWYREFAPFIGYVPQDDIIHRELTVFQALYYSARLRLPQDTSDAEIESRIQQVLHDLGLDGTEDVLIGSPEKRGISGGQRKRVNLAMELLTEPLVLFLDEPTSGLSSEDALVVMKVLRGLADQGKTILVTIHQPGLEIFRLLDNLAMLARDTRDQEPGRLIYYGPAYPDALAFFHTGKPSSLPQTPEVIFQGIGQRPTADWEDAYRASQYFHDYVEKRVRRHGKSKDHMALEKPAPGFFFQWLTLVRRGLAIKLQDRFNSAILLLQAPVVALLIVLVYGKAVSMANVPDRDAWADVSRAMATAIFLMGLASVWFGASNAVREVVGEWAIYRRERMVNLCIPAYVASKFTILGTLAVVQCLILLGVTFAGCRLQGSPLLLFSFLLLTACIGITIGLVLSALARTSEVAIALLPIVLLGMVIFGGAMEPPIYKRAWVAQALSAINPARWCFEGMILVESHQRQRFDQDLQQVVESKSSRGKDMAERLFPQATHRSPIGACFVALLVLLALCAAGSPVILRLRDLRSMMRLNHD